MYIPEIKKDTKCSVEEDYKKGVFKYSADDFLIKISHSGKAHLKLEVFNNKKRVYFTNQRLLYIKEKKDIMNVIDKIKLKQLYIIIPHQPKNT